MPTKPEKDVLVLCNVQQYYYFLNIFFQTTDLVNCCHLILCNYLMLEHLIDPSIFPDVQGTAKYDQFHEASG